MSYHANVARLVAANDDFRHVIYTGKHTQVVVMNIPEGGEVGEETHEHVEQALYIQSGHGEARLDDEVYAVEPGEIVVVTPGTRHNIKNTGTGTLKIITVYSPPNHIDGRVHHTKADADADVADEAFGEQT